MARSPVPIILGGAAILWVVALTLGTLVPVFARSQTSTGLTTADWAAVRFTLSQALLSALLSVGLAIPVARALARRQFPGRGLLVTLLGAPFILPVIVAVFGLLAVYGRSGLINDGLSALGFPVFTIYGLPGVLLAHVFFNLPLAVRLILQGWLAIPAERFRLTEVMGADVHRTLERPMLRDVLPGALLVIFLICLTSFAVALTMGGGPSATTVELTIYQAFRFDGALDRAALLSVVQVVITVAAALLAIWFAIPGAMGAGLDRVRVRWTATSPWIDGVVLALVTLFLLLPIAVLAVRGLPLLLALPNEVWIAAGRSLAVALVSAGLAGAVALSLAVLRYRLGRRGVIVDVVSVLPLAASPLVMGTGLYLILFSFMNPKDGALVVTAMVNAVVSLPFILRALAPAVAEAERGHGRLADVLGLRGWQRLRWLILPRCRRALGFSLGLAAALSMGDLGVIALFSDPDRGTLPLVMHQLMGAYRSDDAAGAGIVLFGLSLLLFWVFDRGGRVRAAA